MTSSDPDAPPLRDEERRRIRRTDGAHRAWRKWGPWLSERQWGTVREDYSPDGSAWDSFPHDHARSRAYRWGEDGLAGLCDREARLCLSVALWNGNDPILKERLFGLTNAQGNHGEDVKEAYWYEDAAPTGSYLRMLYRYPQAAFPYEDLVETNARRGVDEPEYELVDTGVFDENRWFDVHVEYAKASPEDILMRIRIVNAGPEAATIHVVPQAWFRNTWSWSD
ncbi:MAG: glucosidase, partial [Planctomycetota bacterium]|nr:glucosidase [Planctomycetota bacterium]